MTLLTAGHDVEGDDLGYVAFLIGMLEGMAKARGVATVRPGPKLVTLFGLRPDQANDSGTCFPRC